MNTIGRLPRARRSVADASPPRPSCLVPLWFAGLRGAVAFALCLSFPGENVKFVVSSTLMLVLFTTIVGEGTGQKSHRTRVVRMSC